MSGVEQGRTSPAPMDVDLALRVLRAHLDAHERDPAGSERAHDALRIGVAAARAYVRGRTPGRFAALCEALHEPVTVGKASPASLDQVADYLADNGLVVITRDAARKLGIRA